MQEAIPALANKEFVPDDKAQNFNVIYKFDKNTNEAIDAFKKVLDEEVAKIKYFDLTTSIDVYNENTTFVVVHGLTSINGAAGFAELLKGNETDKRGKPKKPKITKDFFAISSPNYAIIQRHKNLSTYLDSQ